MNVKRVDEDVSVVTLTRPPVNALNFQAYEELTTAIKGAQRDSRAIVLTGDGDRAFSAGNDLSDFVSLDGANGAERMRRVRECFWAVRDATVPVIGAINGPAVGSGFGLAACCDFLVVAEDASFSLPELRVGVLGGVQFARRLLPEQAARKFYFLAQPVSAREFASLGASIEIVARTALLERAIEHARMVASYSPHAVGLAKEAMNLVEDMPLQHGYHVEQSFTVSLSGHPDSKEALTSHIERRPPQFARRS